MSTSTRRTVTRADASDVCAAASHLYDAECALHAAHQSHLDAWISAASEKLHQAVADYLAAVARTDQK